MARTTDRDARQLAAVQRLRDLADQPEAQVSYALDLLEKERGIRVVTAALRVLTPAGLPAARSVLLPLYDYYAADGTKRDARGDLRIAILAAVQPIAIADDRALAERALTTYEFLPPTREESTGALRAAGLLLLHELDPEAANYHAVRLLIDPHTSQLNGQPAVAAVHLLAARDQLLPLYYYVTDARGGLSEVIAECLKCLAGAPEGVLAELVDRYRDAEDDLVLAGLFDLILGHAARARYADLLGNFLRTTWRYDVYRYLATTIVAAHAPEIFAVLLAAAREERDPRKIEILIESLSLVRNEPEVDTLVAELQRRKDERRSGSTPVPRGRR